MGGAASRIEDTDWDKADGGLTPEAPCIAGNTPTTDKKTVFLEKENIVNHRDYNIVDEEGNLIFRSREIGSTREWFDLLSPDKNRTTGILSRARKLGWFFDNAWIIYQSVPVYDGQEMDKDATMTAEQEVNFYRAYQINFNMNKSGARIIRYIDYKGKDKRGAEGDVVLVLEKVRDIKEKYQMYLPDKEELCSYWHWDNTIAKHKIELQVAKGCDLALHAVCAILVNVVKVTEKTPLGQITT